MMSSSSTNSMKMRWINGIPFPPHFDPNLFDNLKNWRVLSDDVYIVTYPKSGTTWTQHITKLITSSGIDDGDKITDVMPWIERVEGNEHKEFSSRRFLKSHLSYEMMPGEKPAKSPAKYIYIARNPKDTAVSMYHHVCASLCFDFNGPWDWFFEEYLAGTVIYGPWFDHILGWWQHKDADNILFLKYEDMKKDLPKAIETIASFIGYKLEPQVVDSIAEQCSFQSMKENPAVNYSWASEACRSGKVNFIRKGIVGDWKNYITEDQNRRFNKIYAKKMNGTGLEFEFD